MSTMDKSSALMKEFAMKHKVPVGDTPYIRAKQVQLVEKNPEAAIALFWAAINAGDRVESALKDMAVVMKQLGRADEAIEAIKSFRHRCSAKAQESLDNILLDLYKKCGRVDDQILLLKGKLRLIQRGLIFNGSPTKTARSHGKKFQLSITEETGRLLSNLGWAYMQQNNYVAAEFVYRKAQHFVMDANKACNLGVCLMKQGKLEEAIEILKVVVSMDKKDFKSLEHAKQLLKEIVDLQMRGSSKRLLSNVSSHDYNHHGFDSTSIIDGEVYYSNEKCEFFSSLSDLKEILGVDEILDVVYFEVEINTHKRHRRLPIFEEIIHSNDFSP